MKDYSINTKCVQAGYTPSNGEPRQIPIIQSTTFKYDTSEDMGKLFRTVWPHGIPRPLKYVTVAMVSHAGGYIHDALTGATYVCLVDISMDTSMFIAMHIASVLSMNILMALSFSLLSLFLFVFFLVFFFLSLSLFLFFSFFVCIYIPICLQLS